MYMNLTRFFFLIFVLMLPFFSFSQTVTTSTTNAELEKLLQQFSDLSKQTFEAPNLDIQNNQFDDFIKNTPSGFFPIDENIRAGAISEYLDLKINPNNPGPKEIIKVEIESYLSDLNKATIKWSVNSTLIKQGVGETSFSFQNGDSGETTIIDVSILTNEGYLVEKELLFRPFGVTILWEADTYTPPFYKGKPLMTTQARVRAIAIPDVDSTQNTFTAGNLVYVWKKDGFAVSDASGYGKNSFSFSGPKPYGDTRVMVQVSSVDDTINSEIRVDLPLTNPFILFYEDRPLIGTWYNRPLGEGITLTKKEISLNAAPFFFSNESSETPILVYNWSMNSKKVINRGRIITLKNESGESGASFLTLAMYGIKQTFQSASRSLMITFASNESLGPTF